MKKANRLINEKSPYLLQHAYNPVNWFPWGDEAFTKAREEDKPIFLSLGYSTAIGGKVKTRPTLNYWEHWLYSMWNGLIKISYKEYKIICLVSLLYFS